MKVPTSYLIKRTEDAVGQWPMRLLFRFVFIGTFISVLIAVIFVTVYGTKIVVGLIGAEIAEKSVISVLVQIVIFVSVNLIGFAVAGKISRKTLAKYRESSAEVRKETDSCIQKAKEEQQKAINANERFESNAEELLKKMHVEKARIDEAWKKLLDLHDKVEQK